MNSAPHLELSWAEERRLRSVLSEGVASKTVRLRANAILGCAEGKSNLQVGKELGVTNLTIGKWRREFLEKRVEGFASERRGRRGPELSLTSEEKQTLEMWVRSRGLFPLLAVKARTILSCASGKKNVVVAKETGLSRITVGRLRHDFAFRRLGALKAARAGRPVEALTLTEEERTTLEIWAERAPESIARRAKTILACASGKSNVAVSAEIKLSEKSIGRLRSKFLEQRLTSLKYSGNCFAIGGVVGKQKEMTSAHG